MSKSKVTLVAKYNGVIIGRRTTHVPYSHALILQRNEEIERTEGYEVSPITDTDPITGMTLDKLNVFEPHVVKWLRPDEVDQAKEIYGYKRWLSKDHAKVFEIVPVELEATPDPEIALRRQLDQIVSQVREATARAVHHYATAAGAENEDAIRSACLNLVTTTLMGGSGYQITASKALDDVLQEDQSLFGRLSRQPNHIKALRAIAAGKEPERPYGVVVELEELDLLQFVTEDGTPIVRTDKGLMIPAGKNKYILTKLGRSLLDSLARR